MGIAYLHGNGGGGAGGLGFEIVGGATRPTKPTQNMVWVNTDVEITSYAFSATDPIADSLVEGAGTVLGTIEGRTYTKANAGRAAWAFVCVDGFTGPMLVSPDKDACAYFTSGDHVSTIGSAGNVVHNGVTYYYSTGAWMYGDHTSGISPAFVESSFGEAALLLARTYDPEGMLWVTIANSSSVKSVFTVDKEWVTLYLVSVKQYISGAWSDKSAMNYQNGAWTDWWTGELYTPGNEWESITGGFATKGFPLNTGDAPQSNPATITRNADNIRFTNTDAGCGLCYFVNKIELTDFNTLTFVGEMKYSGNSWYTGLGIWKDISTAVGTNRVAYLNGNSTGGAIDISSVDPGEYYIGFWIRGSGSYINLTSLILS